MNEIPDSRKEVPQRMAAAAQFQKDIGLSHGQSQSIPDMLMTAPLAINLLGNIKLLAFTDHALRIRLTAPHQGFEHLRYPCLSSGMIQIVDLASDVFDCASRNMAAVRMQTNVMFGRSGHVQTILGSLQNPKLAKESLMGKMEEFGEEMNRCAQRTKEIVSAFDKMIVCSRELNAAMANDMADTQREQDMIELSIRKAEAEKKIKEQAIEVLRRQAEDTRKEMEEAREIFQNTAKRDWSALAFGAVADVQGATTSVIHAVINVVRETPRLAVQVVQTAGHTVGHVLGSGQTKITYTESNIPPPLGMPDESDVGIDPALLAAEQIEGQLSRLQSMLHQEDLVDILLDGGFGITACLNRLQDLKNGLGTFKSNHTINANGSIESGIEIASAVLKEKDSVDSQTRLSSNWQKKVQRWQNDLAPSLSSATKLKSKAAAKPGQGFGSTLNPSLPKLGSDNSGYTRVLQARHEKLAIMRAATKDAQETLERSTELQLAAQAKVIEFVRLMDDLDSKTATIDQTKSILRQSIDSMTSMQDQIKELARFFKILAVIIQEVGISQARQFLDTIKDGMTERDNRIEMGFHQTQIASIRETLLTLRGHFSFIIRSTDLYQKIATEHIHPCLRMAALLPLSADAAEQSNAKRKLLEAADESARAIKTLAEEEMINYRKQLQARCEEIEADIGELPPLDAELGMIPAIQDGVKEAREETVGLIAEKCKLDPEILDDL